MSQNRKTLDIFKILFLEKSIIKFSITAILGLAFSVAVILSAIGLMDGFELTLKKSLQSADGDLQINKRNKFLSFKDFEMLKSQPEFQAITGVLQGQGFLINEGESFGVILKGIDLFSFNRVTNLKIKKLNGGIAIGEALAQKLNIKIGDQIAVLLAKGNDAISGEPLLKSFEVQSIFKHQIYEKSLRFVFVEELVLREVLNNKNMYNQLKVSLRNSLKSQKQISKTVKLLRARLGENYSIYPYWHDFEVLLEAVGVEKKTIGIILQLIVIISLFNVVALFIYLTEKKSQDIFMLRALGVNDRYLVKILSLGAFLIWFFSCLVSLLFKDTFQFILKNSTWLKLPGDIYYLTSIELSLTLIDYIIVFSISFIWLLLILLVMIRKLGKQSIMSGIRKG